MAEFKIRSPILGDILRPLTVMGDDANIFFEPDRGLRLKLVCFVGYLDGAVFFRKESLPDFKCPEPTSACIEVAQLVKALLQFRGGAALHFDTEDLVLSLRPTELCRNLAKGLGLLLEAVNVEEDRCVKLALMEERSEFMKIDESKFKYDLVLGIRTDRFVTMLVGAEKHHHLTIFFKGKEICMNRKDMNIYLHKELGEFVSAGPTFDHAVHMKFSLHRLESFLTASKLTSMVWVCWSRDAPALLIFPAGPYCNIHMYSRLTPEKQPRDERPPINLEATPLSMSTTTQEVRFIGA